MSAAAAVRNYLMPYAGCSTVARIPALTLERMLAATNAALTEIYALERQVPRSAVVRAPEVVSIDVLTRYSTAITFTAATDAMLGCTLLIAGDARENRLIKDSGSYALQNPYMGSSTTNASTQVHYDCVTLDTDVAKVHEPIELVENVRWGMTLIPRQDITKMQFGLNRKRIQRPLFAAIEDALLRDIPGMRLVFDSLPAQDYLLSYQATLSAPTITDFSDTRTALLPNGLDKAVLFPWAALKFSSHPDFTGDRSTIEKDAQIASQLWSNFTTPGNAARAVSTMY